jgi:Ca-activated chloride channel family protein
MVTSSRSSQKFVPPGPVPLPGPFPPPIPIEWGLIACDKAIPLLGVAIDVRLSGLSTEVEVRQRYRNTEKVPVEAVYVFPLEEGSAVCGFSIRIGERLVRGKVEERERAFEIYDDAMADGQGAFLLDQERPNVFTASVGNLRPDETVEVQIRYVALARFEGSAVRLAIPTTVAPRYFPAGPPRVGQPESERLNPEHRLSVPYGLTLRVDLDLGGPVARIISPSHPIELSLGGVGAPGARVELAQEEAALDRDFVLLAEAVEPHQPRAKVALEEAGDGEPRTVAMVTFYPELPAEADGSEALFLLDCSGSMEGPSIDQARRALELAIRALSERDTFNVVRFGSRFESLWPAPRSFDESSLAEAVAWLHRVHANLGGTEILAPLRHLLDLKADAERPRQILLLTDGQVGNEAEVVQLAAEHAGRARIFTFGIGTAASDYLVRELARASRAACEFIFPGERIEAKVLRMFNRVRTPALSDLRLDWGGAKVEQAPAETPPLFSGEALTVFGRIQGKCPERVTLHGGGRSWELPLDLATAESGGPIPVLWAREAIRDLERGGLRRGSNQRGSAENRTNRRLIELGQRYGLVSSATSYVAVDERPEGERTLAPAELRPIPVALPDGWGQGGYSGRRVRILDTGPQVLLHGGFSGAPAAAPAQPGAPARAQAQSGPVMAGGFRPPTAAFFESWEPDDAIASQAVPPAADRLYELLLTQKADGSFAWSSALREWLAPIPAEVEKALSTHGEAVVATVLALALLERDEAVREEQWRPAAKKARAWLARQAIHPGNLQTVPWVVSIGRRP